MCWRRSWLQPQRGHRTVMPRRTRPRASPASPLFVSRESVPEDVLEKEREVAASQAEGKPPQAIQKIVEGKLDKYFSTVCLLEQPFVKNPDQTIRELLTENIAKLGENLVVERFARYQLGE